MIHYNCCPCCLVLNGPTTLLEIQRMLKGKPAASGLIGVCNICGNLMAAGLTKDRQTVQSSQILYDWFHKNYSEDDRKRFHEMQEKMHHELGQWG